MSFFNSMNFGGGQLAAMFAALQGLSNSAPSGAPTMPNFPSPAPPKPSDLRFGKPLDPSFNAFIPHFELAMQKLMSGEKSGFPVASFLPAPAFLPGSSNLSASLPDIFSFRPKQTK